MGSNISKSSPSDAISTKIQTLGKMFYNIVVHSEVLDVLRVVYEELVVSASTEHAICLGRNICVCVCVYSCITTQYTKIPAHPSAFVSTLKFTETLFSGQKPIVRILEAFCEKVYYTLHFIYLPSKHYM